MYISSYKGTIKNNDFMLQVIFVCELLHDYLYIRDFFQNL